MKPINADPLTGGTHHAARQFRRDPHPASPWKGEGPDDCTPSASHGEGRGEGLPGDPKSKIQNPKSRHRESGVILIITLLGLMLLAALVLWVVNLGQQVNNRVSTQHAADATVQAGATWMARSLNTVALNNVEMARYIALVAVLDAMPQAVDMAKREDESLRDALQQQLAMGVNTDPTTLRTIVTTAYQQLLDGMIGEVAQMRDLQTIFAAQDVGEMTLAPSGGLWRSIEALGEANTALMDNLGVMAETAALAGGQENMHGEDTSVHLVAAQPGVPVRRGSFDDFQRPVLKGTLPADVDDAVTNRGPWDTVFGYHQDVVEILGTEPGEPGDVDPGGGPGSPLGRGRQTAGGGGRVIERLVGYRTWGTFESLLLQVQDWCNSQNMVHARQTGWSTQVGYTAPSNYRLRGSPRHLHLTSFSMWVEYLAALKLRNLWPLEINTDRFDPEWHIGYDIASAMASSGVVTVRETAYFGVEIKSLYPRGHPSFLTPGTFRMISTEDGSARMVIARGWNDAGTWPNVQNLGPWVWRDEWQYQTIVNDPDIGLMIPYQAILQPDGTVRQEPVPQPVYRVDHWAFGGINTGPVAQTRDPYAGVDRANLTPTDIDHGQIAANNLQSRWQYMSLLGIARRDDVPQAWPTRFRGGRPYPNIVALAQAKVFNNHSWDLWTPMWNAELEPVGEYDGSGVYNTRLDGWITRAGGGGAGGNAVGALGPLVDYLTHARDLAGVTLGH